MTSHLSLELSSTHDIKVTLTGHGNLDFLDKPDDEFAADLTAEIVGKGIPETFPRKDLLMEPAAWIRINGGYSAVLSLRDPQPLCKYPQNINQLRAWLPQEMSEKYPQQRNDAFLALGKLCFQYYRDEQYMREHARVPSSIDLRSLFSIIKDMVHGLASKEAADPLQQQHLETLLTEYQQTGEFSGDCKAASTFTCGLLKHLGIPARRISGRILYEMSTLDIEAKLQEISERIEKIESHHAPEMMLAYPKRKKAEYQQMLAQPQAMEAYQGGEGHVWTEAYLPTINGKGRWFPVDPAMGFSCDYPQYKLQKVCYHVSLLLPSFSEPQDFNIRVDVL
ncbi:transglutaminase domain-containing protein [Candidatus Woesearchaeota archaeon]|nr:transglutaminase domain-containing protein [Candidatus Woesearchaeota archaeon]